MSKIGKQAIQIPEKTTAKLESGKILFNGPKGSFEVNVNNRLFSTEITKENLLTISPIKKTDEIKKSWGMSRSLLKNAIHGVSVGYEKILELKGGGYRAALKGTVLNLQLGYSHDINYNIPKGITLTVEKQTTIKINGIDKEQVGRVAAIIKSYRPVEPYKGKGIKEKGQYVLRKEGKKK